MLDSIFGTDKKWQSSLVNFGTVLLFTQGELHLQCICSCLVLTFFSYTNANTLFFRWDCSTKAQRSVGFHGAGGGGACGGSSLQEYNKTQLSLRRCRRRSSVNLKPSFVSSVDALHLCQALTSAASTVKKKKMHLDMTLLQSKFLSCLLLL